MQDPTRSTRTAASVMTPSPRTCSLFSSVLEAVMIFRDADCVAVPVVDDGVPVGVLTDRDVALASSEDPDLMTRPVTDIMTKGAISVAPDASLEEVREKLGAHGVHHLLVIDAAGQLQGIITSSDLAPLMPERSVG
jgi:CBS domain-containing protein